MVKGTTVFSTKAGHTRQILGSFNADGGTLGTAESNLISTVNLNRPDANYIVSMQLKEDFPGHFFAVGDAAILTPEP